MNTGNLLVELKNREAFWRNSTQDPYGVANAVITALVEVRNAIEASEDDNATLRQFVDNLRRLTPAPPKAITYELGVEIVNAVQDHLYPK